MGQNNKCIDYISKMKMMSERNQKYDILSPKITKFTNISDNNSNKGEINYSKDLYNEIEKEIKKSISFITNNNSF